MNEIDVFHHDDDRMSFETLAQENGFRFWLSSSLAHALGYEDSASVKKAINKATAVCVTLNIPVQENFQSYESPSDKNDLKLSRFACYLTVMNADVRNPKVAKAQAYFAGLAEAFSTLLSQAQGVERVLVRGEISEREGTLIDPTIIIAN